MKNSISASADPPVVGQKSFGFWFSELVAAVVIADSVDVWAVAPLMVTDVGLRLQVGASFTLVIDVVTAQVSATVPLNP
jgi:hypothetical protein